MYVVSFYSVSEPVYLSPLFHFEAVRVAAPLKTYYSQSREHLAASLTSLSGLPELLELL